MRLSRKTYLRELDIEIHVTAELEEGTMMLSEPEGQELKLHYGTVPRHRLLEGTFSGYCYFWRKGTKKKGGLSLMEKLLELMPLWRQESDGSNGGNFGFHSQDFLPSRSLLLPQPTVFIVGEITL